MQFQGKHWQLQEFYLHEHVLLLFTGFFSLWMLGCGLFMDKLPSFVFHFPFFSSLFLVLSSLLAIGLKFNEWVKEKREILILSLSVFYCIYLATGIYETSFNKNLIGFFGVFVALAGSYFLNYRYVTILLTTAYVSLGIVHLALPSGVVGYPLWMYMVFVPLAMLAYYYVISQSIFTYRRLVESERNLLMKTRELNNIMDSLDAMIAYKDKENNYLSVNQAMAKFIGKKKEDIVGTSLYDLIKLSDAERYHEEDKKIIQENKPIRNILEKISSLDGKRTVWLRSNKIPFYHENGEVAGIVFSAEDVTEQVEAEQKTRASEERFRMIFERAPDGMGLIAIPNNNFIKVNRALAKMIGYSEKELIGLTPTDIAHPEDRYLTLPLFHEAIKNDRSEYTTEQRLEHKSGRVITCRLSAHIVREGGKPKYLICIFQDFSKEKEHEQKLKNYAQKLEESNQNLQEFAYAASHDLREPLRTVVSYVQLLQRYLDMDDQSPEVREFMDYIVGGSRRMEKQITALLQYSRVGRGELKKELVDLDYSLEVVQAVLHAQITDSQAIITSDKLPKLQAVPSQIEAVIQNLISNSLKYKRPEIQPRIHISAKRENENWTISFKDNGIGIEEDYLEKIFAVFRRLHTQDEFPGSGVGLAICRRIIQRHGGVIWAESDGISGSTFHFSLPAIEVEEHPVRKETSPDIKVLSHVK